METWEHFSAFGDLAELEHVCEILSLNASEANEDLEYITGESSALIRQLNRQATYSERILEQEIPGLYQRTWMASLFWRLFVTLDEVTEKPYRLAEEIGQIQEDLHKVLIAAHEVFDPYHRAALLKKAVSDGVEQGIASAKQTRSEQAKRAVSDRTDQKQRREFSAWADDALSNGATAATVGELQSLEGFKPEWSRLNETTLKRWARESGFSFKTGRPRKK